MRYDVLIVGGGLAGLALAVALRGTRLSVGLIEGRAPVFAEGWDARVYAVSPANATFLDSIGVWRHLPAERLCRVENMEVRGDAGGRLDFSAYAAGASALAWIVESKVLLAELHESAKRQSNLTLHCPANPAALTFGAEDGQVDLGDGRSLRARLVVAADGADSWTRAAAGLHVEFRPYRQRGVVANFNAAIPHRGTAFQWFRDDGILAYLPLPGNRVSLVWSTPDAHAEELLALSAEAFRSRVAAAGSHRLGDLELITPPAAFDLRLMRARHPIGPRLALIGDAAHTIHPLSGHGINLGFRDAQALAGVLADKPDHVDCGDRSLLRRYERMRKEEVVALQGVTDILHRLFTPAQRPLSRLRNLGLNVTDRLPVIKDVLIRYAIAS